MGRPKKNANLVEEENKIPDTEVAETPVTDEPAEEPAPKAKRTRKPKDNGATLNTESPSSRFTPHRIYARILYIEPILGTSPSDPEIARRFIASKAPDAISTEEEIASIGADAVTERSMTVFSRKADGTPIHWDYQWKGHEKDAWSLLKKVDGTASADIKAGKKMIDKGIFPGPRMIPINFLGKIGYCERPLRASTPKGERVSLAISEQIPAGAYSDVWFDCMVASDVEFVREVLDYGRFSGMGQWRNSGKGRFLWEEHKGSFDGPVIGGNFQDFYPSYEEFAAEFEAFPLI